MYLDCGDGATVAYHAQCSSTTVLSIVRRNGIEIAKRGGKRKPLAVTDAEICRRYLGGQSGVTIAADIKTNPVTIYKILESNGIPRREKWRHLRTPG